MPTFRSDDFNTIYQLAPAIWIATQLPAAAIDNGQWIIDNDWMLRMSRPAVGVINLEVSTCYLDCHAAKGSYRGKLLCGSQ